MIPTSSKLVGGLALAALLVAGVFFGLWKVSLSNLETERTARIKAETAADQYLTQVKLLANSITAAESRLEEQKQQDRERIEALRGQVDQFLLDEEAANQVAEELEQIERESGNVQVFDSRGIN